MQLANYDLCHHSHACIATMEGYKLFGGDRQGRRGGGMALYVRECFSVVELGAGKDQVESLWVRIRGRANTAAIPVGVLQTP